jgi:hypothetical protein
MLRAFKVLALTVTMLWALMPQLACFFPEDVHAPSECCKRMAGDCCETTVREDVAAPAKEIREFTPHFQVAAFAVTAPLEFDGPEIRDDYVSPDESHVPVPILRI